MLFVKNPNYNPNDPNSKRYVDVGTARNEANNRANFTNGLFGSAGNLRQPVTASTFFTEPTLSFNAFSSGFGGNQRNAQTTPAVTPNLQGNLQKMINSASVPSPQSQVPTVSGIVRNAVNNPLQTTIDGASPIPEPTVTPTPGGGAATSVPGAPNVRTSNLAELAAAAGLSLAEYQQLLADESLATGEQINEIREDLNIPGLITDAFKRPKKSSLEMYRELYDELGLRDIKDRIAEVDERLNSRREDLVEAAGEVKNNPWLSQGSRTGRLRILNELATADISNILDERQQYLDIYDDGIGKIERQVGFALSDRAESRQLTVDELNFMLGEAERQQGVLERSNLTEGLRNVPEFLTAQVAEIRRQEAVEAANAAASASGAGGIGSFDDVFKVRKDFEDNSKTFIDVRNAYGRVKASVVDPSPAGDLALIFNYMKMLDPGSVVREGEFANAQNSGSIPERIRAQYNNVLQGKRLSAAQRADFEDRSNRLFQDASEKQIQLQIRTQEFARAFGLDPDLTAPDLGTGGSAVVQPSAADTAYVNFVMDNL